MKKRIMPLVLGSVFLLTLSSAHSQTKKAVPAKVASKTIDDKVTQKASATDIESGKMLLSKSDCLACHKVDVKLVGPSFIEIAKKYPATETNYTYLADKVIKGGSGVWGKIPMPPHATIPVTDAKKMVTYILSLK